MFWSNWIGFLRVHSNRERDVVPVDGSLKQEQEISKVELKERGRKEVLIKL